MATNFLANRRRTQRRARSPIVSAFGNPPAPQTGGIDPVPNTGGFGLDTNRMGMPPPIPNPLETSGQGMPGFGLPMDSSRQGMNEMNYGLPTVNPALANRRPRVY